MSRWPVTMWSPPGNSRSFRRIRAAMSGSAATIRPVSPLLRDRSSMKVFTSSLRFRLTSCGRDPGKSPRRGAPWGMPCRLPRSFLRSSSRLMAGCPMNRPRISRSCSQPGSCGSRQRTRSVRLRSLPALQLPHAQSCGQPRWTIFAPALRVMAQIGKFAAGESTGTWAMTRYCLSHRRIWPWNRRTVRTFFRAPRPIAASDTVCSTTVAPACSMSGPPQA